MTSVYYILRGAYWFIFTLSKSTTSRPKVEVTRGNMLIEWSVRTLVRFSRYVNVRHGWSLYWLHAVSRADLLNEGAENTHKSTKSHTVCPYTSTRLVTSTNQRGMKCPKLFFCFNFSRTSKFLKTLYARILRKSGKCFRSPQSIRHLDWFTNWKFYHHHHHLLLHHKGSTRYIYVHTQKNTVNKYRV